MLKQKSHGRNKLDLQPGAKASVNEEPKGVSIESCPRRGDLDWRQIEKLVRICAILLRREYSRISWESWEDIQQDLLLRAVKSDLFGYDPTRSGLQSFIYRRLNWAALDHVRRMSREEKRNTRLTEAKKHEAREAPMSCAQTPLLIRDFLRALNNAWRVDLSDRMKDVICHTLVEDQKLQDWAQEARMHSSHASRMRKEGLSRILNRLESACTF